MYRKCKFKEKHLYYIVCTWCIHMGHMGPFCNSSLILSFDVDPTTLYTVCVIETHLLRNLVGLIGRMWKKDLLHTQMRSYEMTYFFLSTARNVWQQWRRTSAVWCPCVVKRRENSAPWKLAVLAKVLLFLFSPFPWHTHSLENIFGEHSWRIDDTGFATCVGVERDMDDACVSGSSWSPVSLVDYGLFTDCVFCATDVAN